MKIVWDEPKRLANLDKHGLDFADLNEIERGLEAARSADQFFRGISILCIDGTCRPVSTNASPAPGFTGFIRVVPMLRKALSLFGPRPIVR